MTLFQKVLKRTFDICLALFGLLLVGWLVVFTMLIILVFTKSNSLFTQTRVGRDGMVFKIFKIRTMKNVQGLTSTVTLAGDCRVPPWGAQLRKWKIDELPQLINVLWGQMSIVGPRPDVTGYADKLNGGDRIILSVRPGITGPAQLAYRNEESILAGQVDALNYNNEIIWPDKVRINRLYVEKYSIMRDFYYIFRTVVG